MHERRCTKLQQIADAPSHDNMRAGAEDANGSEARGLYPPRTSVLSGWNAQLQPGARVCDPQRELKAAVSAPGPKQVDAPGSAAAQVEPRRTQDGAKVLDQIDHEPKRDRLRRRG